MLTGFVLLSFWLSGHRLSHGSLHNDKRPNVPNHQKTHKDLSAGSIVIESVFYIFNFNHVPNEHAKSDLYELLNEVVISWQCTPAISRRSHDVVRDLYFYSQKVKTCSKTLSPETELAFTALLIKQLLLSKVY